jgi:hypothetical protein
MFSAIEKSSSRPLPLRSSGTRKMPAATAPRRREADVLPSSVTSPPMRPVDAEDRARQLGAPRADEPGEAEDLARVEVEVDVVVGVGRGAHALDSSDHAPRPASGGGG